MRRRMLFVAAAIGIGMALASPGVSGAQVSQDSVTGGGQIVGTSFSVDARSGPSGENPTGTVILLSSPVLGFRVEGSVTCLTVTGNRAVIGLRQTGGNFPVGGGFIEVTDDTPDTFAFTGTASGEPPTVCPPTLGIGGTALGTGDIVVVDAPALPTSKDQCTNGGWQTYGVFNNQGDCVSFVATGGKDPPASSP